MSRVTDIPGSTIMEVSTIPNGKAIIAEGLAGIRLGGYTPASAGGAGRVRAFSSSVGMPAPVDDGFDEISRRLGGARETSSSTLWPR